MGKFKRIIILSVMIVVTIISSTIATAQTLLRMNIDYINDDQFPVLEAFVSISDTQGQPVGGLSTKDFVLVEDDQTVRQFDVSEIENTQQSLAIVLLMDVSGSMGSQNPPSPLDQASEAARAFIDQLAPQDQVAVIKFANETTTLQTLTAEKETVKTSLVGLQTEGNQTSMYDAIVEGVGLLKNFSHRRIIVLVTDGRDTGRGLFNFDQTMDEAQAWSIPVYPLGFGNKIDRDELSRMAILTGGVAQFQPDAAQLQTSFDNVLRVLREQYVIRYVSAISADEKQHSLSITTNYQGAQLQASHAYTAHRSQILVTLPDYATGQVVGGIEYFRPVTDWPAPLRTLDIVVDDFTLTSIQNPPFEYQWNTVQTEEQIPIGEHNFGFRLTDIAGNTGQTELTLNVQTPLSMQITNPSEGETVRGSVVIKIDVSTLPDIEPGRVDVTIDGQPAGNALLSPPYEYKWNLAFVPAEKHVVAATAYDASGLFSASDEKKVIVAVNPFNWIIALTVFLFIVGVTIWTAVRRKKQQTGVSTPILPSTGQASLREMDGLHPNQSWILGESEFRLGRKGDENDLQLKGLSASRKHATIRFENGQHVIYTLSSNNPVLVNDMPVGQRYILKNGDIIRLGETTLLFEGR